MPREKLCTKWPERRPDMTQAVEDLRRVYTTEKEERLGQRQGPAHDREYLYRLYGELFGTAE